MSLAEFGAFDTLRTSRLPKLPPIEAASSFPASARDPSPPGRDPLDAVGPDDLAGGGARSERVLRMALEPPSISGVSLRAALPPHNAGPLVQTQAPGAPPRPATDGYLNNNGYRNGTAARAAAPASMNGSPTGNGYRLGAIQSILVLIYNVYQNILTLKRLYRYMLFDLSKKSIIQKCFWNMVN